MCTVGCASRTGLGETDQDATKPGARPGLCNDIDPYGIAD